MQPPRSLTSKRAPSNSFPAVAICPTSSNPSSLYRSSTSFLGTYSSNRSCCFHSRNVEKGNSRKPISRILHKHLIAPVLMAEGADLAVEAPYEMLRSGYLFAVVHAQTEEAPCFLAQ